MQKASQHSGSTEEGHLTCPSSMNGRGSLEEVAHELGLKGKEWLQESRRGDEGRNVGYVYICPQEGHIQNPRALTCMGTGGMSWAALLHPGVCLQPQDLQGETQLGPQLAFRHVK